MALSSAAVTTPSRSEAGWRQGAIVAKKYELLAALGKGGMGEVWRARHLELGSEVALKRLDPRLAEQAVARGRFLREAKAAAELKSPHVIQIHDYGVDGAAPYIAMELLEGEPLDERLRRGPLPPEVAWRVVDHVARAVTKAHEAGIVHRDLKPANVWITRNDGEESELLRSTWLVKVLDFGIAKRLEAGVSVDATTESPSTASGAIVGTPHYMSPEQARSKPVDRRSDLWALGVIAYECVVGARPFAADSFGELVLRICADPLPIPSRHASVPDGFDAWFARAVARDPAERFASAREMTDALRPILLPGAMDRPPVTPDPDTAGPASASDARDAATPVGAPTAPANRGSRSVIFGAALLLAVVGVASAVAFVFGGRSGAGAPPSSAVAASSGSPPAARGPARARQVTFTGGAQSAVLSADGKTAYFLSTDGAERVLWRQNVDEESAREVVRMKSIADFDVSDAGDRVVVVGEPAGTDELAVVLVDAAGKAEVQTWRPYFTVSWAPDGRAFAATGNSVGRKFFVQHVDGRVDEIALDVPHDFLVDVTWLRGVDRIVVTTLRGDGTRQLWSVPAAGGTPVQLVADRPRWRTHLATRDSIYLVTEPEPSSEVLRFPIDPVSGATLGPPERVFSGVPVETLSRSADGTRLLYTKREDPSNLWLLDAAGSGAPRVQLTRGTRSHALPLFSPDGAQVAFLRRGNTGELYSMPVAGGPEARISPAGIDVRSFAWAPDGERLALLARREGALELFTVAASGGAPKPLPLATPLEMAGDGARTLSWSPGNRLLVRLAGNRDWAVVDPGTGAVERHLFPERKGWAFHAQSSASGDAVAFRNVPGETPSSYGLWLLPASGAGPNKLATGRVFPLRIAGDGDGVFAVTEIADAERGLAAVVRVPIRGGEPRTVVDFDFAPSVVSYADITADGKRVVCAVGRPETDVWLLDESPAP